MEGKNRMTKGITLVELILSISIIGMFSTMAVVNFRSNKQDDILRVVGFRVADAVRAAQSYALAGVPEHVDSTIAGAQEFGVSVSKTEEGIGEVTVFADGNGGAAGIYDTATDKEIRKISLDPDNHKTVILDTVTLDGTSATSLPVSIAFKKPDAAGFINGKNGIEDPKEIVLTFKHIQSGHTKTVTINRVTGRVDARY